MLKVAFKDSIPIAFGYIPLGIAFGVLLKGLGFHWIWATIMGLFVFAGSAQFMAIALFSQNAGPSDFFYATLLLNIRHLFYGLATKNLYSFGGFRKLYSIFALTDETFSLITNDRSLNKQAPWILAISGFNHLWWVIGCSLGAGVRTIYPINAKGMEFSLTCLFVALLIEKIANITNLKSILCGLSIGILLILFYDGSHFLLLGTVCCLPILFIDSRKLKS
jgi:4-azaleucine resistance transporter AzlC